MLTAIAETLTALPTATAAPTTTLAPPQQRGLGVSTAEGPAQGIAAGATPTPAFALGDREGPTPSATGEPASATPTPTAPPTPDPRAGRGELVYEDNFDNPIRWLPGEDTTSQVVVSDGRLLISFKAGGGYVLRYSGKGLGDFFAQITMTVSQCRPDDHIGLLFRVADERNYYAVGLRCDGQYRVRRVVAGEGEMLADWTPSPAIQAGRGGSNNLAVRAAGGEFQFFVNDQFLGAASDETFASGQFGVYAAAAYAEGLEAGFDDLQVWSVTP